MIPEHLLEAYRRTRVEIHGAGRAWIVPAVAEGRPAPGWPQTGPDVWVLTAWNPRSRPLPHAENRARQDALRAMLRSAGLPALDAVGRALDQDWAEDSLAIIGVTFATAHTLARRFDQQAVFRVRAGWLSIHDTGGPLGRAAQSGSTT